MLAVTIAASPFTALVLIVKKILPAIKPETVKMLTMTQSNAHSTPRSIRWLLGIAILAHLVIVASIVRQPFNVQNAPPSERSLVFPLYNDAVHRIGPFADFFAVYRSGFCLRQGIDFYGSGTRITEVPYFYHYRYLPVVAYALGLPLSFLSARAAAILWTLLLEAVLAAFLLLYWRRTEDLGTRVLAAVFLLLSTPYFLEVHMGQCTFATLALVGIALLLVEAPAEPTAGAYRPATGAAASGSGSSGKRMVGAAAAFSAAVLLKLFPFVLAPALLRRGRMGRFWLLAAASSLVLLNLPYFLLHSLSWSHYLERNFSPGAVWDGLSPGNHGLVYILHLLIQDLGGAWSRAGWVDFVQIWRVLVLGPACLLVLLSRRKDFVAGAAVLIFAHFAAFHQVWEHHWSGALILGLLLLRHPAFSERERGVRRLGLILGLALWAMPTPFIFLDHLYGAGGGDPSETWPSWARLLPPAVKVVPLIGILSFLVRDFARAGWVLPFRRAPGG